MEPLRPYQLEALKKWEKRPDKRLILAHVPGSGKTRTALVAANSGHYKRILVVCPARARTTWLNEAARWAPFLKLFVISFGKERKTISAAQRKYREVAYAAEKKIVSYGFLAEQGILGIYDLIIVDECHKLSNPQSTQSKQVRQLFKLCPFTPALFLTGTFIRNEVAGCWNQLDTLWPGLWGKPTLGGDVSFTFRRKYCLSRESEYSPSGFEYYGANPEAMPLLQKKLAPFIHVVTDEMVEPFLPPCTVRPLYIDDASTYQQAVQSWAQEAADNYTHVGIICYNLATAAETAKGLKGRPVFCTNGLTMAQREQLLVDARAAKECFFVATSECIGESVSLTFCRKVLITQWRSTPGQAVQLLKRFRRAETGSKSVTIEYLIFPDDISKSETLLARAGAVADLLGKNTSTETFNEIMSPRPLTEERLDNLFESMFSEQRTITTGEDDE